MNFDVRPWASDLTPKRWRRSGMVNAVLRMGLLMAVLSSCALPAPGAGEPSAASTRPIIAATAAPSTCAGYVALSIDDGPTETSGDLIAVLQSYRVPATFFNTGEHTAQLPAQVAREQGVANVQFGNHSWDHPDLALLPEAQVYDQLLRTQDVQGPGTRFFRPPFGSANDVVDRVIKQMGLVEVLWTKDSKDYDALSVQQIIDQSRGMKDGGILLLHDRPLTAEALPGIIASYYAQRLCIGRIATSTQPAAPAESPELLFYARAVAP